ncbi:hypothetical protein [Seohaeicola zhoushanensis]|uniref:Uncharacterized protein n=1 Tax=Seohaeicola zhoushanensis TaxID=1569283 RepID=A0A8J3GZS4_9RHOB|nr:hypothetical protein [Seohaeicola zhoushanensis]GHF56877.1 hypothetical protein GCM10017056_30400 [Seohaeicola zhoushanensis]
MNTKYTFHIGAYTPETIPMARLAQYMHALASLMGNGNAVHFDHLETGSTKLVTKVDNEDAPKVATNLRLVRNGEGSVDATKAAAEINRLLAEDNAAGRLYEGDDTTAEIIAFPGVNKVAEVVFGPFNQEGTLDGILISVSGADETVHIQLQNGSTRFTGIDTTRDVARRMAKHMYEPVRVEGVGRWLRDHDGKWLLKRFRVSEFTILTNDSLKDTVRMLREIDGSEWKDLDDPLASARLMRDKGNGLH